MEAVPDGILIRPELIGHRFVDDGDLMGVLAICVGKFTTANQGNAQGLKEIGCDVIELSQGATVAGSFILALGEHSAAKSTTQGEIGRDGRGVDTRNRLGTFDGGAKILLGSSFLVMQSTQIESEYEELFCLEPRIYALRVLHAADEQARTDERDKCQCNFRYDQKTAERAACPAHSTAAPSNFQRIDEVWSCDFDRRSEPDDYSGEKSDAQSKEENARIEAEIDIAIQNEGRPERPQNGAACIGDGQTNDTRENRKDHTFSE